MEHSKSGKSLSAEHKLFVREEVEKQLTSLPGATLKLIQSEVGRRVEETERHYKRLAYFITGFSAIIAAILGFNWNSGRNTMARETAEVQAIHSNLMTQVAELTKMSATAMEMHQELTNRIRELSALDNIVTAQQLQKAFERVDALTLETEQALFTASVSAAEAGDAFAYDRLVSWTTNSGNLKWKAVQAVANIQGSFTGPFNSQEEEKVSVKWDLTSGFETARLFYFSSSPESRVSLIQTIGTATNYSQSDRINFLVNAALTDSTIMGRRRAVSILNSEVKQDFVAFNPDAIRAWWQTNGQQVFSPKK